MIFGRPSCGYFRNTDGEPCYGGQRDGVRPCDARVIGFLVLVDKKGQHALPVCSEHYLMRKGNLGETTHFEELT